MARAGADVAVLDRNTSAAHATSTWINTNLEAAGLGGRARHFAVDVSNWKEMTDAVAQAQHAFKDKSKLRIGVNCAGITVDKFLTKMEEEDWDRVMDINGKGTFFLTKAVAQAIIAEQNGVAPTEMGMGGSIVNISSIIGKIGNLGQVNYSASKGAVISLSKSAAKELARHQIRVNSVLPGFIDTPMAQAVPDKVKAKLTPTIPLGAFGRPEDIANVAVFLSSDLASYVTGAAVEVTGGFNM